MSKESCEGYYTGHKGVCVCVHVYKCMCVKDRGWLRLATFLNNSPLLFQTLKYDLVG